MNSYYAIILQQPILCFEYIESIKQLCTQYMASGGNGMMSDMIVESISEGTVKIVMG